MDPENESIMDPTATFATAEPAPKANPCAIVAPRPVKIVKYELLCFLGAPKFFWYQILLYLKAFLRHRFAEGALAASWEEEVLLQEEVLERQEEGRIW